MGTDHTVARRGASRPVGTWRPSSTRARAAGWPAAPLLALALALWAQGAAAATRVPVRVGAIREAVLGRSTAVYVFGLASGPDGNLWLADSGCTGVGRCALLRVTLDGRIAEFRHGLDPGSVPLAIAAGAGGDLWFTDAGSRPAIGRITTAGAIAEFARGLRGGEPFEITTGPGADMWFTVQGRRPAIGRITPRGRITEYRRGLRRGSVPFGITPGPGGSAWFTDRGCSGSGRCAIGRITRAGRIAEFTAGLRRGGQPLGIARGWGSAIWFADASGAIGRVTPAGRISEHGAGLTPGSSPVAIAAGPDGSMWFSDEGTTPAVGRITPAGAVREWRAGLLAGSQPAVMAAGPDGRMWFTDEGGLAALGAVRTGVSAAARARPALRPAGGGALRCASGRWASWNGLRPSPRLLPFDGYRWLRDGALVPGARGQTFVPRGAAGSRFACAETVTYPSPLMVTAAAVSRPAPAGG